MRWSEVAAELAPEVYSLIVNRFMAGRGCAYLAARAAERDAELVVLVRNLDDALCCLREMRALLAEHAARHEPPAAGAAAIMPSALAAGAGLPAEPRRLAAALNEAVNCAAHAAAEMSGDGEYTWLLGHLDEMVFSLALARLLSALLFTS
ncbi:MAG TPA: hypothetical protein VKV26_08490 [Dehalococcoidia bacterium]|nr:hypothetical protein [Dehalococcoidia bacterium]